MRTFHLPLKSRIWSAVCGAAVCAGAVQGAARDPTEIAQRAQIAAATLADAVVVDCQLPGRLQQLGGMRTYLTPGALVRLSAIDCRTRGGEYTVGDLSSGTLSLSRWLPLAEKDNVEAQYYVARIYANGMSGVPVDYSKAAQWYQRAAQKKYAPAMQELGYLYEQGLGVQQDPIVGLNLQRQASGLGDDLDYASKLAENKEESARQIAALTDQLDASDTSVQSLRAQLDQANDKQRQSSAQAIRDQARLRDLRSQLELAKRDDSGQGAARLKQLQEQLAASETQLKERQEAMGALSTDLTVQQAQLSARLADSQAANSRLNELLVSGRNENEALRARLAQSEQRLVQSQQELSALRADYLKETNALAARSEELQQIRARGNDSASALLDAKQREIDRQTLQVTSLERQLAGFRQQTATVGASAADATTRNKELETALAALRAQYTQQQQELQAQRSEFARLQSQSKDDRAALLAQMTAQLTEKARELEDRQRRIASLQLETNQLRDQYNQERQQHGNDAAAAVNDLQRKREALELLEMQSAAQQLKLVQERESLTQQLASAQQTNQQKIAALETDVRDKGQQIAAAHAQLAALEQQGHADKPPPPPLASNVTYRLAQSSTVARSDPSALIQMVRDLGPANYHALVIGNGKYRYMAGLKTPGSDALEIAKLLEGRYGFRVKLMRDATRDEIMSAMNEYARTLTDADRLLIYYAGHGGTRFGPPERAFWLGIDADPQLPSSWLSAQTVSDAIWQIHARHVLLVADSCFSSAITHTVSTVVARAEDARRIKIEWRLGARMVLTSGQNEPVVDSASVDTTHSLFAAQLITVLRQNNILLSGEMLAHEVSSRMAAESARTGLKQTPTYSNLEDQQHMFGDFFFVPVASSVQVASLN
jgi:TPR repeat protein